VHHRTSEVPRSLFSWTLLKRRMWYIFRDRVRDEIRRTGANFAGNSFFLHQMSPAQGRTLQTWTEEEQENRKHFIHPLILTFISSIAAEARSTKRLEKEADSLTKKILRQSLELLNRDEETAQRTSALLPEEKAAYESVGKEIKKSLEMLSQSGSPGYNPNRLKLAANRSSRDNLNSLPKSKIVKSTKSNTSASGLPATSSLPASVTSSVRSPAGLMSEKELKKASEVATSEATTPAPPPKGLKGKWARALDAVNRSNTGSTSEGQAATGEPSKTAK